jgi:hypothetical protein
MNADERRFLGRVLLPLPATQEWTDGRGEGVSLVAAGSEEKENIEHPTGIPGAFFDVRRWVFDVRCSAGCDLNSPLRPQGNRLTSLHV